MGKPSKRKNPGVGVDFRKVKHKVGKKLPKAQNETRTDFQSRSINLPNQSLTQDKAGAAVSERNLTLKELVGQLSHHNTHTRRDALAGLQQLLTAHPAEGRRHTALLLEALATRVADGEQTVRTALLSLLRSAALPAVGPAALAPFVPIFMAHLSAALTHLSADVRLDALSVLEALTEAAPQLMATHSLLCASLAHYTGLLSRTNRGKSVKSQALTGLLKVMSSLQRFLSTALAAAARAATAAGQQAATAAGSSATAAPIAGGASGTESAAAAAAGMPADGGGSTSSSSNEPLLAARSALAPPASLRLPAAAELLRLYAHVSGSKGSSNLPEPRQQQQGQAGKPQGSQQAATASGGGDSSLVGSAAQLQAQSLQLLGVLFDCWAEAAPGSLSTAPEQEAAQVLVHILTCCQLLLVHVAPSVSTAAGAGGGSEAPTAAATGVSASAPTAAGQGGCCPGFNTPSNDRTLWLTQAASLVLPKLLKVFPVVAPASSLPAALQELLQRFNLLSTQLLAGFMAGGVLWPRAAGSGVGGRPGGSSSNSSKALAAQQDWQERLLRFMADVLTTGSCLPTAALAALEQPAAISSSSKQGNSSTPSPSNKRQRKQQQQGAEARSVPGPAGSSSSSVLTVLQCLQQLLPQLTPEPRQQLLKAVEKLLAAPHSAAAAAAAGQQLQAAATAAGAAGTQFVTGPVRTACQQLQLQLMLRYLYEAVPDPTQEAAVAGWVAAAPKQLWECGTSRPHVSRLMLQMVYHAARLAQPGSLVQQQLLQIQPQLAPLLATALPAIAAKQSKKRKVQRLQDAQHQQRQRDAATDPAAAVLVLVGPLAGLPAPVQALAFDALCFQPQLQPPMLKAIALACRLTSYSDAAVARLLDSVLSGAAAGSLAPDQYLSLAATLVSPPPAGGFTDRATRVNVGGDFGRHQQLVDAVCRWMQSYGPQQELLQLLAPVAVEQWQQQQQQCAAADSSSSSSTAPTFRCSSYSCASLAAVAAGCWRPASAASSSSSSSSSCSSPAGGELIPKPLLGLLPAMLASYCTSTILAQGGDAAVVGSAAAAAEAAAAAGGGSGGVQAVAITAVGRNGADAAACVVSAVDSCMPLLLPLLAAVPDLLLLPFLEQLVGWCIAAADSSSSRKSRLAGAAVLSNGLAVAVQVCEAVLAQQRLKACLMQQEPCLQQLLARLVAAGQQLQQEGGDATVVAGVNQLQTAVHLLFGH